MSALGEGGEIGKSGPGGARAGWEQILYEGATRNERPGRGRRNREIWARGRQRRVGADPVLSSYKK